MKKITLLILLATVSRFISFGQTPNVTADDIKYWIGNGSNEAILALYFPNDDPGNIYAWGYRWNTVAGQTITVGQMLADINATDSRLTVLGLAQGFVSFRYADPDAGINFSGCDGMWVYNVNGGASGGVNGQGLSSGDMATFYCYWAWETDFTTLNIIPVTNPNASSTFTVTASSNANGMVTPTGDSTVPANESILYHFTANPGYYLESIMLDESLDVMAQLSDTNTFLLENIQAAHTIRALYSPVSAGDTYTIHAKCGNNGTISPIGDSTVVAGSSITYSFIPDEGYALKSVVLGNTEIIGLVSGNSYTISGITEKDTISAQFAVAKNNSITTGDILHWIGEGNHEVILAVNWCDPEIAFAWGYRFNSDSILVSEIMNDIKNSDTRFDYTDAGGYVSEITYQDNTYDLALAGAYWMYNVNEEKADGINIQYVRHNDIIEFGDESCGLSDDSWNYVWTTVITPVSVPAPTTISSYKTANPVSIHPNPASDHTYLSLNGIEGNIAMKIVDINGKLIQAEQLHVTNSMVKRIETMNFAKGIYFIHLQNDNTTQTHKLIVY